MAISTRKKAKSFLDDVDRFIDRRHIDKLLKKKLGKSKDAAGNPAYPPLCMCKVLLLQRWYNLSGQGMDDALADRISFCRFVGFSFYYDTPDASTICRFRNHLMEKGLDQKLFDMLTRQLQAHTLIVKQGAIVDATIVSSSRRPRKFHTVEQVEGDEGEGPEYEVNTTYSDDTDAAWTKKAGKLHMATDAEHGFIIGGHVTPANRAYTKELMEVVKEAKAPKGSMGFANKGYAGALNRCGLEDKQITDGIMYKAARGRQLTKPEKLVNRVISGLRGKVERAFGTLKKDYGLQRARCLGCAKVKLEFLLSATAFNLKKAALMLEQCAGELKKRSRAGRNGLIGGGGTHIMPRER